MIDGDDYINRFTAINLQFDLAMKAVEGFLKSEEAVDRYLNDELKSMQAFTEDAAKSSGFDPKQHWAFSEEGSSKYLQGTKENLPRRLNEVNNRIRQNKLILVVTAFESFMKDIHREVLRQDPNLLKPDRQIPLGKVVSVPRDEIVAEEIEREVQSLDRKSVEERYLYFDKRLNIDWFGGTIVPLLKPVLELRNKILHENPDIDVTDKNLQLAHLVCFSLPLVCVMQAEVLYPGSFKLGKSNPAQFREIMEKQGRIKPNTSLNLTRGTDAPLAG
jgi:hypothetical protein